MAKWRILTVDGEPVEKSVEAKPPRRSPENPISAAGRAFAHQQRKAAGRRFTMQVGEAAVVKQQSQARQRELEADLSLSAADRIACLASRDIGGAPEGVIVTGLPGGPRTLKGGGVEKTEDERVSFENVLLQPAWNGVSYDAA